MECTGAALPSVVGHRMPDLRTDPPESACAKNLRTYPYPLRVGCETQRVAHRGD